ncbi:MAG TPA: serine/threonine-protein kinase [Actinospica sp.]|jgi:serine/threonine protein kinase|nr:serine/threonine-protein kinase [Actinospica sp.]
MMTDGAERIAGRYRQISRVGGGAMGVVWRAHDEVLGRTVAVKLLRGSIGLSSSQIEQAHSRARREARIAARLQHPHAVTVHDVVEHEGRPCLVMEYVPSRSLAQILADGEVLEANVVARFGAQVASALIAAHQAGIVHRDIKPGNILLADDGGEDGVGGVGGVAKLTDFGISRAIDDVTLTATGEMLGTPAYISPEVARGGGADPASDVFSLGATLYAAVEGVPPFGTGPTPMAVVMRIANGEVRRPEQSGALIDTLMWMLSHDPADRPTMDVVRRKLESAMTMREEPEAADHVEDAAPPRKRSRALTGILVATAAVLTTTAVAVFIAHSNSSATNTASAAATNQPDTPSASATSTVGLQMTAAISRYYSLVPDHLDQSWQYLTAYYQRERATSYATYQQFWGQIQSVSISNLEAAPPTAAIATIDYHYKNGRTVRERTTFGLVEIDGAWKIANSSVLSSTTL